MKYNTPIYNDLFIKFFYCDFNLSTFYYKYEYLLRDYIIENFVKNSSEDELIKEIKKMLSIYNKKNKKILIDDEFPKNRLIKIMKPYLLLYLQSQYSFVHIIKNNTSILLYNKLKIFRNFNQKFGRKIYKMGFKYDSNFKRKSYIKSVEFLDNHIAFNYNEELKFLTNHTYYNEVNTNEEVSYVFTVYNNNNVNIVEEYIGEEVEDGEGEVEDGEGEEEEGEGEEDEGEEDEGEEGEEGEEDEGEDEYVEENVEESNDVNNETDYEDYEDYEDGSIS